MTALDASVRRDLARAALATAGTSAWRTLTLLDLARAAGRPVSDFYGASMGEAVDCVEEAFDRAIALANTSAEAAHIRMHLDRLMRDSQPRGSEVQKK